MLSPETLASFAGSGSRQALTPEVLQELMAQQQGPGFFGSVASAGLGAVGNVLDVLASPGYAVRSLLRGNVGDFLEHNVEFGANVATGGMASKLYENLAGEEWTTKAESPEFTDLMESYLGRNMRPTGWKGFAADVVGGALTDPLTYLTMGGGAAFGVGRSSLAGTRTAAQAGNLVTRGLMQTVGGRAALKAQLGAQAAQDALAALNTGSLRGLAGSSMQALEEAGASVFRQRLGAPFAKLGDDFFANTANREVIDSVTQGLFDEGLLQRNALNFAGKRIPGTEGAGDALRGMAREVGAPALAGEALGGFLGLPSGIGGLAGIAARRIPAVNQAVDATVEKLWKGASAKLYDKFSQSGLPKAAEEAARQFWQRKQGADRESLETVQRVFQGLSGEQARAMGEALSAFEGKIRGGNADALAAAAGAGVGREAGQEILGALSGVDPGVAQRFTDYTFEFGAGGAQRAAEANGWAIREPFAVARQLEALGPERATALVRGASSEPSLEALRSAAAREAAQSAGLPEETARPMVDALFGAFDKQQDDMIGLGTWKDMPRRFYLPHSVTPEVAKRFGEKLPDFTKARRSQTIAEFEDQVRKRALKEGVDLTDLDEVAVRDVRDMLHLRQLAHNETMWKEGLKKHFRDFAGASAKLDADTAADNYVRRLLEPMKSRGALQGLLAKVNRFTKPLQTIYVPAFHARNMVSTWGQVLLDPSLTVKDSAKIMAAQVADMPLLRVLSKPSREQGAVYKFLEAANNPTSEAAQKAAAGVTIGKYSGDEVLRYAKQGVIQNNFGEEVLEELGLGVKSLAHNREALAKGTGLKAKANKLATRASAYIEDRARLTAFVGLLEKGVGAEEAIKRVQRIFVNYEVQSSVDRLLRDVVPYARFTVGNTPAAIEAALKRPGLLTPHVAAAKSVQATDPLANEEARSGFAANLGGGQFLGGFGMPLQAAGETLNNLTSLEGGRKLLGQTAMPINFPLQAVTNRNLYFGGDFLRPTRMPDGTPAVGPVSETAYGGKELSPGASALLFSGPLSRQAGIARTLAEGSLGQIVSKIATGVGVRSTDEERAVRAVVERWLDDAVKRGDVGKVQSFYQRGTSPEAEEAVRIYLQLRRAERERKKKG